MRSEWFDVDKIPIGRMKTADAESMPMIVPGKNVKTTSFATVLLHLIERVQSCKKADHSDESEEPDKA
ncbi:MAG: hypothetical protein HGA33_03950 [Candidatus Moranbacteria bacterium]|nr:hypothetical protein [Candidatus Moranbacteria bacterium]